MERRPPLPVSKSFVVCRQIILDSYTNEYVLIGPRHEAAFTSFPVVVDLAIFARWTSVQGDYELEIQLQDLEGHIIWGERQEMLLQCHDPLVVSVLVLQPLHVFFPKPAKYEIVFLANGEEVIRDVFWAHPPAPPQAPASEEND